MRERERVVLGIFEFLKRTALVCYVLTHRPKQKSTLQLIGVGAAVAFLGFSFAGCSDNAEAEAERQPTEVENVVEPVDATDTEEVGVEFDFTRLPENSIVRAWGFELLNAEQQEFIVKLDDKSVEEFYKLPQEARQKFAFFVLDNIRPYVDNNLTTIGMRYRYQENPQTPEEFLQNEKYMHAVINAMNHVVVNEHGDRHRVWEVDTAKKMGNAFWDISDGDSREARNWFNMVGRLGGETGRAYSPIPRIKRNIIGYAETEGGDMAIYHYLDDSTVDFYDNHEQRFTVFGMREIATIDGVSSLRPLQVGGYGSGTPGWIPLESNLLFQDR